MLMVFNNLHPRPHSIGNRNYKDQAQRLQDQNGTSNQSKEDKKFSEGI